MKTISVKIKDIVNSQKMYYVYVAISVLACLLTVEQLIGQFYESVRWLAYIATFFSAMKLKDNTYKVYAVFTKLWHRILLFLLEAYSTFAVVGMYFLDTGSVQYDVRYSTIAYLLMSYIWIRPIVIAVLAFLLSVGNERYSGSGRKAGLRLRLVLIGIVVFPCLIFLIGFNPAITCPDFEHCLTMTHTIWEKGVPMTDWHPPFYVFLLYIWFKLCNSVTLMVLLQIVCFAAVFVDGILYFYKKGISKKVLVVIYCFITFGISNILQLITTWKDTPYMISILWLTLVLMKYVLDREIYMGRWSWYFQLFFALILTALFRQNGLIPAIAVIIFLLVVSKFSKKMMALGAIWTLALLLVKYPLYDAMEVRPAPQLKFFALANDIMYSYYRGDNMSDGAMEIVNKVTSGEPDNFEYNPQYVKYNQTEPSGYTVPEFLKIYIDNVIRNPRDAVMAVLIRNSVIWSIVKPIDERAGNVNFLGEINTVPDNMYPFRQTNMLTMKLADLSRRIGNNGILFIIYWRTGIYNLLILLLLGLLLPEIGGGRFKRLCYILPFIPILMNLFVLAVSSGWSDYRYFWPGMLICMFLLCYFIVLRRELYCVDEIRQENDVVGIRQMLFLSGVGIILLIYFVAENYTDYLSERNYTLRVQEDIDSYLELLNYNRYEAIMEVRDTAIFEIQRYRTLFAGMGIELPETTDDHYFFIIGQDGSDILTDFDDDGSMAESVIGQVSFYLDENDSKQGGDTGGYRIYLNDEECYHVAPEENVGTEEDPYSRTDIRVWVRDRKSKKIIDYVSFSYVIEDGALKTMRAGHEKD